MTIVQLRAEIAPIREAQRIKQLSAADLRKGNRRTDDNSKAARNSMTAAIRQDEPARISDSRDGT